MEREDLAVMKAMKRKYEDGGERKVGGENGKARIETERQRREWSKYGLKDPD